MYPPVEVYTHLHLPQVGLRPLQLIRSRVPGILPPRQEATIHPVKHSQARILFCIIVIPDTFRLDKLCFIKYKYINISANLINLASTFSLSNLFPSGNRYVAWKKLGPTKFNEYQLDHFIIMQTKKYSWYMYIW